MTEQLRYLIITIGLLISIQVSIAPCIAQSDKPKFSQEETVKQKDIQNERKAFIKELIRKGIFQEVKIPGRIPHLWVKPMFYALDFEDKQAFVSVVYAYYFEKQSSGYIMLYDSKTGKEIGRFSKVDGGLKLF